MKILAKISAKTYARPDAVFAIWADVDHWPDFDSGVKWAKLSGNFATDGNLVIKPKGAPKVKSTIVQIESNKTFINMSHLPGAKLQFDHTVTRQNEQTIVTVTVSVSGPLEWLWVKILGKNQQTDIEKATANLIAKAEGRA